MPNYMPETIQTKCPLCAGEGQVRFVHDCSHNADYNPNFNPRKEWWYCPSCHHMFTGAYPQDLSAAVVGFTDPQYTVVKPQLFSMYSDILNRMGVRAGMSILDVGFGAGEMLLVANEMGLECAGVDIRDEYVNRLRKLLPDADLFRTGVFPSAILFDTTDVVTLGDVLEHVTDPRRMLKDVKIALRTGGTLWVSTPNFDSAFAVAAGERDPMRGVCEHIQWFSRKSLYKLLKQEGFEVISYNVSKHFNGCMEVIARKE